MVVTGTSVKKGQVAIITGRIHSFFHEKRKLKVRKKAKQKQTEKFITVGGIL